MTASRHSREGGFTLIELVVAFALLAAAIATFASIFGDAAAQSTRAEAERTATTVAESLLARVGRDLPLTVEDRSGVTEEGFQWSLRVTPLDVPRATKDRLVRSYRVDVRVAWSDLWHDRSISLATMRLAPRG